MCRGGLSRVPLWGNLWGPLWPLMGKAQGILTRQEQWYIVGFPRACWGLSISGHSRPDRSKPLLVQDIRLGCEGSAVQICPSRPIKSVSFTRCETVERRQLWRGAPKNAVMPAPHGSPQSAATGGMHLIRDESPITCAQRSRPVLSSMVKIQTAVTALAGHSALARWMSPPHRRKRSHVSPFDKSGCGG